MDLNVKQWRYHHQVQESSDSSDLPQSAAKLPRLVEVQQQYQEQLPHPSPSGSHPSPPPPAPLPLFVPQPTTKLTHLSPLIPPDHLTPTTPARFSKMGSCFNVGQWQELELQALIFRHMLAGAAIPPQLLHLVKNSLLLNTSSPPPHPLLQHYYNNSHYHPSLLQSGYWGRASLDPEPGRCRRTDGKKWRCSRDVVAGHKYCERHMHRGRNRSRKPVEIPTPSAAGDGRSGGVLKISTGFAAGQLLSGATYFEPNGPSPSIDLLHLNRSPSESKTVTKSGLFEASNEATGDGKSSGQVLRHFFDDWPRSLQEHDDNGRSNPGPITSSSPCLSISSPSNPASDFSLKLSTGNGDDLQAGHQELGGSVVVERGRLQSNWAGGGGWGTTSMGGGPLAEALRSSSSTSNSSPTSVLHQLPVRISAAETSYIST